MDPTLVALTERLSNLERIVAEMRAQPERPKNWLENLTGSVTDIETFQEVLRLGREYRQSDRQPENVSGEK